MYSSLNKLVRMMPQTPYFFNNTIIENIKYVKRDVTVKEVYSASHKTRLHKSIIKRHDNY